MTLAPVTDVSCHFACDNLCAESNHGVRGGSAIWADFSFQRLLFPIRSPFFRLLVSNIDVA
jgi:hypothetical protein